VADRKRRSCPAGECHELLSAFEPSGPARRCEGQLDDGVGREQIAVQAHLPGKHVGPEPLARLARADDRHAAR